MISLMSGHDYSIVLSMTKYIFIISIHLICVNDYKLSWIQTSILIKTWKKK